MKYGRSNGKLALPVSLHDALVCNDGSDEIGSQRPAHCGISYTPMLDAEHAVSQRRRSSKWVTLRASIQAPIVTSEDKPTETDHSTAAAKAGSEDQISNSVVGTSAVSMSQWEGVTRLHCRRI